MPRDSRELWQKSERELSEELLVAHAYAALQLGVAGAVSATGRQAPGPSWPFWAFFGAVLLIDCVLAVAYLAELRRRRCWVAPGVRSHSYLGSIGYSLACVARAGGLFALLLGAVAWIG